jgi:hypothetical protein
MTDWRNDPAYRARVARIVQQRGVLFAVKDVVDSHGVSLAPAKTFVDEVIAEHGIPVPRTSVGSIIRPVLVLLLVLAVLKSC